MNPACQPRPQRPPSWFGNLTTVQLNASPRALNGRHPFSTTLHPARPQRSPSWFGNLTIAQLNASPCARNGRHRAKKHSRRYIARKSVRGKFPGLEMQEWVSPHNRHTLRSTIGFAKPTCQGSALWNPLTTLRKSIEFRTLFVLHNQFISNML